MSVIIRFDSDRTNVRLSVHSLKTLAIDSERNGLTEFYDTAGSTNFIAAYPTDEIDEIIPENADDHVTKLYD